MILSSRGFSVAEMAVSIGVTGLIVMGAAHILIQSSKVTKALESKVNIQKYQVSLSNTLSSEKAWFNTIEDPANGALHNCLRSAGRDITACIHTKSEMDISVTPGHPLNQLRRGNNSIELDFSNPSQGFTSKGATCNTFDPSGDETCPFQAQIYWRFECPNKVDATVNYCENPIVVLTTLYTNASPVKHKKVNLNQSNSVAIKNPEVSYDPVAFVCSSASGTYIPPGRCYQNRFPEHECPAGEFFNAINEDGSVVCTASGPICNFVRTADSILEVFPLLVLRVDLSEASTSTVTVNYSATDITATGGGVDYTLSPGTLTFNPGETSASIPIGITNDSIVEPREEFRIVLDTPVNCTLGSRFRQVARIGDDDTEPRFHFTSSSYSTSDLAANTVDIDVRLTAAHTASATVDYAVTSGTATAGTDYNLPAGTLTFAPGELVKTFGVDVLLDGLAEGVETVEITLSNALPSPDVLVDPGRNQTTVNISDTLPALSFVASSVSVDESSGAISLDVNLSGPSATTVYVNYVLDNGASTATSGLDFTFTNGTLTFDPGVMTQSISYNVLTDTITDPDEEIVLRLNSPVDALLGSPNRHVATITEPPAGPSTDTWQIVPIGGDGTCTTNDFAPITSCVYPARGVCADILGSPCSVPSSGNCSPTGGCSITDPDCSGTIINCGDPFGG